LLGVSSDDRPLREACTLEERIQSAGGEAMTHEGGADPGDGDARVARKLGVAGFRLVVDAAALALWTLFVVLIFLAAGWPDWTFYVLLLGGVAGYVVVTPPWIRKRGE